MLFKYSGIDASGNKISAKIEACTLEDAKSKLKVKKILYSKLQEDKALINATFERKTSISATILAEISRDISIYLNSGISLINAIKLINERYKKNKKLSTFFESISIFLDEGKSFYMALEQQKSIKLPEFYKQSIKISESGGLLKTVLLELSVFLKEQERVKKQMLTAMTYPSFILVVSLLVVGFMLSFIVPKVTAIFTQYDQALPPLTSFVIVLGDFFSSYYTWIFSFIIVTIGIVGYTYSNYKAFKFVIDKLLLKIPFMGSMIELNELSRFSYMNSILIRSGVPIVQSFNLSSNIIKNSVIQELFLEASSKVVEGEKLSKTLENSLIYSIDSAFIHAVAIGEETSELSTILSNLSKLYNENSQDKVKIFLTLLEPVFMLIVGVIVGTIVFAMLLPIFTMNLG
mgnify:CR=1 FL=1